MHLSIGIIIYLAHEGNWVSNLDNYSRSLEGVTWVHTQVFYSRTEFAKLSSVCKAFQQVWASVFSSFLHVFVN